MDKKDSGKKWYEHPDEPPEVVYVDDDETDWSAKTTDAIGKQCATVACTKTEKISYEKPLCWEHWKAFDNGELDECERCHWFINGWGIYFAASFELEQELENGYRTQQATKPQTLAYAMMDSPVGIAAWIIEKFKSWSDLDNDDIESVYTKDELLTNIMLYITTGTFNTASWIYYGRREEGGRILTSSKKRVEVPTACAVFPEELLSWPPQSYVNRMYNVTQWTEFERGGHFAAMERPEILVSDIQTFLRILRRDMR